MKREELKIYENDSATSVVKSNVSSWKELNKDQRTLYHYLGNTIHSIKRDIASEGRDILRRFHASLLPEYEPPYIYKAKQPVTLQELISITTPPGFEYITYLDYFFADNFNAVEFIKKEELNISDNIISFDKIDQDNLIYVSDDADLVTYNIPNKVITTRTNASYKNTNSITVEFFDTKYAFIPGPIKIISVKNHLKENLTYEIKEITQTSKFQQRLDINNNGVIDQEDLESFQNVVGLSAQQIDAEVWNRDYAKFDLKKNGLIEEDDFAVVVNGLWNGKEQGTLIQLPIQNIGFKVEYVPLDQPEISDVKVVNGSIVTRSLNTFNSDILKEKYKNEFGIFGLVEPDTAPFRGEIDIDHNVNFVKSDGAVFDKEKLSYKDIDKYRPLFLYDLDDIMMILAQNPKDLKCRIYLVDMLNMAIEYSDDYFDLDIQEKVLGIGALTTNAEIYLICQDVEGKKYLRTYKLDKLYYTVNQSELAFYSTKLGSFQIQPTGTPLELLDGETDTSGTYITLDLYPVKVQNSIDDFAFNWGITRLPGETNRELKNRILDFWIHLQGNEKTGMIYGISKNLGVLPEDLNFIAPTISYNVQTKNPWSELQPFKFLIVDRTARSLDLFAFKNYSFIVKNFKKVFTFTELYRVSSESIELDEEFAEYTFNFPNQSYSERLYTKSDIDWNFPGELISLEEEIVLENNIINLSKANYFQENFSEKEVHVYYDAYDFDLNIHYTNKDVITLPYFQNTEGLGKSVVRIENLMAPGDFRSLKILNETNREQFIIDMKTKNNSTWGKVIGDQSLYNTFSATPELVKDTVWNGLSFNKHFDTDGSLPWSF